MAARPWPRGCGRSFRRIELSRKIRRAILRSDSLDCFSALTRGTTMSGIAKADIRVMNSSGTPRRDHRAEMWLSHSALPWEAKNLHNEASGPAESMQKPNSSSRQPCAGHLTVFHTDRYNEHGCGSASSLACSRSARLPRQYVAFSALLRAAFGVLCAASARAGYGLIATVAAFGITAIPSSCRLKHEIQLIAASSISFG